MRQHTDKRALKRNAVFVQHTARRSGSPISGLTVVDSLLSAGYEVLVIFAIPGPIEQAYLDKGCRVEYLAHGHWLNGRTWFRRSIAAIRDAMAAVRFVGRFIKDRPDLVYANTIVSVSAIAAARVLSIASVWHLRELFEDVGGEMLPPLGGKSVVRAAVRALPNRVICISRAVANNVCGWDKMGEVLVIGNAVPDHTLLNEEVIPSARERFGLCADEFVVAVPTTLRPVKGLEFLILTAALMRDREIGVRFLVSGENGHPFAQHLMSLCEDRRLGSVVKFVGEVKDMSMLYAAADVVCVPSRSESFGRCVIEAFAHRRAVVATRVGGMEELIKNGCTGILVDYGDVESLAGALERLRADPLQRAVIADAGWRQAFNNFSETVVRQRIRAIVETVSN